MHAPSAQARQAEEEAGGVPLTPIQEYYRNGRGAKGNQGIIPGGQTMGAKRGVKAEKKPAKQAGFAAPMRGMPPRMTNPMLAAAGGGSDSSDSEGEEGCAAPPCFFSITTP